MSRVNSRVNVGAIAAALMAVAAFAQIVHAEHDPASDAPATSEDVARAYMEAYETVDWDRLGAFYDPDAVFYDPGPSPDQGGVIRWEGRDAILAKLQEYRTSTGVLAIDYGDATIYPSGDATVFVGDVDARYPGEDGSIVHWRSTIVTVITVKDGKVVRHDDFPDYVGAVTEREG